MSDLRGVSLSRSRATSLAWTEHGPRISPVVLLQASLLLLVVSNVGRIPVFDLGDRQAPLLINDLAVSLAVLGGALTALARRSLRLDRVALAALLFACVGGLSAMAAGPRFGLSGFEIMASLAYLARWLLYFGLYLVVVNFVQARHLPSVWNALEWSMLAFAAFGIVQSIFLPNFAFIVYPDQTNAWDAQRHRLVSTVLDPNIAAVMMVIALLVQFARMSSGVRVAQWKPALLLAAIVMTLSRSGLVALFCGVLVILFARGLRTKLVRFGALAMIGLIVALPRLLTFAEDYNRLTVSDGSAMTRLVTWQRALATLWENPWFGIGFNTFGFVQEHRGFERLGSSGSYSAEGGLLFIAVMTGAVGLSIFMVMIWQVWRLCRAGWRDAQATPEERGLCVGTAAVTLAICVHSVFVNSLLVPFVMQPLWVLWGLVFVARTRMKQAARVA